MSTEVATKNNGPITAFGGFLEKLKPQLALALPKHLTADRMARLALTAFSSSEKLQQCDPKSIAASIMTAGQLGLEPGVNGAGFLVPYGRTCTFVPGWKGLVDLVARSGRGTVYTGVIFKDQDYTFIDGAKRDLIIHNETELDDPEDITHAFAIGWVKDATMPIIELWTVGKIRKHRDKYNKVGKAHYSFRDWEMYARKVPLLQVLKYMPASIELANAIAIANAEDSGRGAIIENGIVIESDGYGYGSDGQGAPGQNERQYYPDDKFATELPKWQKLIADKKKTADEVIAMAESRYPLTDSQKAAIKNSSSPSEKDPAQEQVGQPGAAGPSVTFDQVKEKLNKAEDIDLLDVAADLIGEVPDPNHRVELQDIYMKRRAVL